MATVSGLIDKLITLDENTDSTDGDNAGERVRILQYMQEVMEYVWNQGEFKFKVTGPTTLTVPAGSASSPSKVALPTDFATFGKLGAVYETSGNRQLEEISMTELLQTWGSNASHALPLQFAVIGDLDSNTSASTIRPYFLGVPNLSAEATVRLWYQAVTPILVDATGDTNNLYKLPIQYHNSVILPGVRVKLARSKGDGRDWNDQFQAGLRSLIAQETPRRSTVQRLPPWTSKKVW
jgi:hypothetical protein